MITGAHVLFYSTDPDGDRAFFRDVLEFPAIDIGHGWLIFGLSPAEMAVHPSDGTFGQDHAGHTMLGAIVYLMCDDVHATVAWLSGKHVRCTNVETEDWGLRTTVPLPSGGSVGLYQPTHPTALGLARTS